MLRRALFAWAFNPATRESDPPREIALAVGWAARASLPVAALDDPATVRVALGACAKTLDGKPAAGSTQRRKRSVFYKRPRLRRRTRPPALQPDRPHPVDRPGRRPERRPQGGGQPGPGEEAAGRRPRTQRPGRAPGGVLRLPAVSQHLKILKDAGLVEDVAAGTRRIYRLNPAALAALRDQLDTYWQRALTRYADIVETPKEED